MKFIFQLLCIAILTIALVSAEEEEERLTCTKRLNNPEFIPECVKLYCKCMFLCDNPDKASLFVDSDGRKARKYNGDLSIMECFEKNGCDPKADVEKMIPCTSCIMDQPEETKTCEGFQVATYERVTKKGDEL